MVDIIIKDFPAPPSVNKYLMPVMGKVKFGRHGKPYAAGRLVKTKEHQNYEGECIKWELGHMAGLNKLREEIIQRRQEVEGVGKTFSLHLEYFLVMPEAQFLTADNRPVQIDADNFIKPLQDNLFRILKIDDSYCFKPGIEKILAENAVKPHMVIRIREHRPRRYQELKAQLGI